MTSHSLRMVTVGNGAGRGVCSCGWQSRVSDDGYMFQAEHYTTDDIRCDWQEHVRARESEATVEKTMRAAWSFVELGDRPDIALTICPGADDQEQMTMLYAYDARGAFMVEPVSDQFAFDPALVERVVARLDAFG